MKDQDDNKNKDENKNQGDNRVKYGKNHKNNKTSLY